MLDKKARKVELTPQKCSFQSPMGQGKILGCWLVETFSTSSLKPLN